MIKNLLHSIIVCPDWTKNYPKIEYGKGVYLYDNVGKRYLDASSGSAAVSNLGHGLTEIGDVINEQVRKATILPTHTFSSEIVETYLEKLVSFSPKGFKRAWTCMSGTEAVENSLKAALQYQQLIGQNKRHKIISRWFSYHGNSIFTLDVGGMKYRRGMYEKWLHNFPHISPAYKYRYGEGMTDGEYTDWCIKEFIQCIESNDPDTIAAFIAEPVVGAALGAVPPPKDYFKKIRKICDNYGILLISDEVMTGFGRLGTPFGIEKFGVTPDIIASGKGISGGYFPLSAILLHERIANTFEENQSSFKGGHTFACNPVGAAVGNFVIDYIKDNNLLKNVNNMGICLKQQLKELEKFELVGDVRGEGLLLGIELVKDKYTKQPFPIENDIGQRIFNDALKHGVILYPGKGSVDGVLGNHILICPPLTVNKSEILEIAGTLQLVIKNAEEAMSISY
ncbi:aspartate aminotransferase family protein [Yeosuana marina]|uniref:aminotransferase family protein n=1 Tax=Yeosuana marina TaxID=1565536 RepID=UPI0030C8BD90